MGGGLIQLVAYGAQNIYLNGNPQMSYFKSVYKRHTRFAIETICQYGSGEKKFGNLLSFTISRNADLIGKCYLEFLLKFKDKDNNFVKFCKLQQINNYKKGKNSIPKSFGYNLIDYIEVGIGGTKIDTRTGHWMAINSEIRHSFNKQLKNLFLIFILNKILFYIINYIINKIYIKMTYYKF